MHKSLKETPFHAHCSLVLLNSTALRYIVLVCIHLDHFVPKLTYTFVTARFKLLGQVWVCIYKKGSTFKWMLYQSLPRITRKKKCLESRRPRNNATQKQNKASQRETRIPKSVSQNAHLCTLHLQVLLAFNNRDRQQMKKLKISIAVTLDIVQSNSQKANSLRWRNLTQQ